MRNLESMKNLILLMSIFSLLLSSCKEECPEPSTPCTDESNPDCPNYDPCFGENEVSAEFSMGEFLGSNLPDSIRWYEGQGTLITPRLIRFRAHLDDAQYTWHIGNEVLETQSVERLFNENLIGETITVSLVVEKSPNTQCFPADDGRDSLALTYEVVEYCDLPIVTRYRGVFTEGVDVSPSDSVEMEFRYVDSNGDCDRELTDFYNLAGDETYQNGIQSRLASEFILLNGNGGNVSPLGKASLDIETNIMTAEYEYRFEQWRYIGRPIE